MRIAYLMPGAGGTFYCENCLRDAATIRALHKLGHDPIMVPLYLPLDIDGPAPVARSPVFFGGINVYLQQKWSFFRKTPRWIDAFFDSPRLLKWAASKAGMTRAQDLAETTLSMLRGEHGHQTKELERLTAWLAETEKPDVVSLSNAMLIGVARHVKERLGVPIVCALQDEDIFLDSLPEPHRQQAWDAIAERVGDVDAFIAVSRYYGDLMRERLRLPPEKLHVVYNGLRVEGYGPAPSPPEPPVIGFLERMCPEKGLDVLADAFLLLRGRFPGLKLRAAGGWTTADEPFLAAIRKRLAADGAEAEILPNLDREERIPFLQGLSVLSVPARHGEAFGMYVLEALASGVPVVLPRRGSFPELVEATGGGVLYDDAGPQSLADAIASLLSNPQLARRLGEQGRKAVADRFNIERSAQEIIRVYESILKQQKE